MTYRIACKDCDSPCCLGCNVYTLWQALRQGRFNGLMDEHHTIHISTGVVEVYVARIVSGSVLCHADGVDKPSKMDYCNWGEREEDEGSDG